MIRLRCLRRDRLWLAATFVLAAALGGVVAADEPRGFSVGILRRDGLLLPFATFDGKHWRNNWPAPQSFELTVPISIGSVPARWWGTPGPRESWQAWIDGAPSSLRVVQPDWVGVQCTRSITLRTNYRASATVPPNTIQPYPKDGLAVSPPQSVERIEILPAAGAEALALAPQVLDAFNRAERTTEAQSGHPVKPRKREQVEPAIEALYAFGEKPRVYYVEAARAYRGLGQSPDECLAVGVGTGWFVRDGDSVRPLLMAVDLLDCDRRGGSYMLPLGALRLGARLFWFAQFSGWDHERYVVIEISPKRAEAVVDTWGGGC
jgi:hypothetical protein